MSESGTILTSGIAVPCNNENPPEEVETLEGWSIEGGGAPEEETKRTAGIGMVVAAFGGQEVVGALVGRELPEGTVIGREGEKPVSGDRAIKSD